MKKLKQSQALVAHTYNPSSAGGRDLEDHGSSPAQEKNETQVCPMQGLAE
jgi:hypothetical protein